MLTEAYLFRTWVNRDIHVQGALTCQKSAPSCDINNSIMLTEER